MACKHSHKEVLSIRSVLLLISIRKDQSRINSRHMDEQNSLKQAEIIAKLARKLKSVSSQTKVTTGVIAESTRFPAPKL